MDANRAAGTVAIIVAVVMAMSVVRISAVSTTISTISTTVATAVSAITAVPAAIAASIGPDDVIVVAVAYDHGRDAAASSDRVVIVKVVRTSASQCEKHHRHRDASQ